MGLVHGLGSTRQGGAEGGGAVRGEQGRAHGTGAVRRQQGSGWLEHCDGGSYMLWEGWGGRGRVGCQDGGTAERQTGSGREEEQCMGRRVWVGRWGCGQAGAGQDPQGGRGGLLRWGSGLQAASAVAQARAEGSVKAADRQENDKREDLDVLWGPLGTAQQAAGGRLQGRVQLWMGQEGTRRKGEGTPICGACGDTLRAREPEGRSQRVRVERQPSCTVLV